MSREPHRLPSGTELDFGEKATKVHIHRSGSGRRTLARINTALAYVIGFITFIGGGDVKAREIDMYVVRDNESGTRHTGVIFSLRRRHARGSSTLPRPPRNRQGVYDQHTLQTLSPEE